jgi:hypothetical protein
MIVALSCCSTAMRAVANMPGRSLPSSFLKSASISIVRVAGSSVPVRRLSVPLTTLPAECIDFGFDLQAVFEEAGFDFDDGHLQAQSAEIRELQKHVATSGGEGTGIDATVGDGAGEGCFDLREVDERVGAFHAGLGDGEFGFGIIDGLGQDEVGRLGAGLVEAFHLDLGGGDFGAVADEVGLELGHFDLNEMLLCRDDIAFINGDFFDVTGHTRLQRDLLPRRKTRGQADPAVNRALLRLRGRQFECEGAGGEEG